MNKSNSYLKWFATGFVLLLASWLGVAAIQSPPTPIVRSAEMTTWTGIATYKDALAAATATGYVVDPLIVGFVDRAAWNGKEFVVDGWALRSGQPEQHLTIAVFHGGKLRGTTTPAIERQDVASGRSLPSGPASNVGFELKGAADCDPTTDLVAVAVAADKTMNVLPNVKPIEGCGNVPASRRSDAAERP